MNVVFIGALITGKNLADLKIKLKTLYKCLRGLRTIFLERMIFQSSLIQNKGKMLIFTLLKWIKKEPKILEGPSDAF